MPTIRQQLIFLLEQGEMSARDISQELKIQEKEVYEHLVHIKRTLKSRKKTLHVDPFYCLICDYVFKDRQRMTKPGRCPKCKKSHIQGAMYRID